MNTLENETFNKYITDIVGWWCIRYTQVSIGLSINYPLNFAVAQQK